MGPCTLCKVKIHASWRSKVRANDVVVPSVFCGFVVRAENGQTVLAGAGNLNAVQDALCPEAEACLAAPTATMNRGMSNIVFELDSPNK